MVYGVNDAGKCLGGHCETVLSIVRITELDGSKAIPDRMVKQIQLSGIELVLLKIGHAFAFARRALLCPQPPQRGGVACAAASTRATGSVGATHHVGSFPSRVHV